MAEAINQNCWSRSGWAGRGTIKKCAWDVARWCRQNKRKSILLVQEWLGQRGQGTIKICAGVWQDSECGVGRKNAQAGGYAARKRLHAVATDATVESCVLARLEPCVLARLEPYVPARLEPCALTS